MIAKIIAVVTVGAAAVAAVQFFLFSFIIHQIE